MLWFIEYFRSNSGIPVNSSIGLSSLNAARHRGKVVTKLNGYCGFWILCKPVGNKESPKQVEYHEASYDMRGNVRWIAPLRADKE